MVFLSVLAAETRPEQLQGQRQSMWRVQTFYQEQLQRQTNGCKYIITWGRGWCWDGEGFLNVKGVTIVKCLYKNTSTWSMQGQTHTIISFLFTKPCNLCCDGGAAGVNCRKKKSGSFLVPRDILWAVKRADSRDLAARDEARPFDLRGEFTVMWSDL